MTRPEITQNHLDDFKKLFPNDPRIGALTLAEVLENTSGRSVDWSSIRFEPHPVESAAAISITPCQKQIAYVVFDVICLAVGAVGVRAAVQARTIEQIAVVVAPAASRLEAIIARMVAEGASSTTRAKGVFEILQTIYSGGMLGAVFSAFVGSLSWWDMILYSVTGLATIIAALATDGVAFVAQVILLLATFGFLVSDCVKAYNTCSGSPAPTPPAPTSGAFPSGRLVNQADSTPVRPAACMFNEQLYLFWKSNDPSQTIYFSASADGTSWPSGKRINPVDSTANAVSACVFSEKLYVFWRSTSSSNAIFYSVSENGTSWAASKQINAVDATGSAPTACVYDGKLYLFWRATDASSGIVYSASADGTSWPNGERINDSDSTASALAACVANGKLYLFWSATNEGHSLRYSASPDGASWPSSQQVSADDSTPGALAVCAHDNDIHLFWKASSSDAIFYGTLARGITWLGSHRINSADTTPDAPTVGMFRQTTYLFWKSSDSSNRIYWSASDLPGANPLPFEPVVAIKTLTGNYLTIVNNGGLGGGNVAIQTDRRVVGPWEKFTVQVIDREKQTFALRTSNGFYVTATNGGAIGGPNDATSPVHTDATKFGPWEKLSFEQQMDGTFAICTTDGFYLTAVNGGNVGGPNARPSAIHTDAKALGPWETFTLVNTPV